MALVSAVLLLAGGASPGDAAEPAAQRGAQPGAALVPFGLAQDDGWVVEFEDGFDGDSLDAAKWSSGFGWGETSGNSYGYCDPDNNEVGDGLLVQRIERGGRGDRPFSVGCVNTQDRFSQLYGFWEARIRMAGCRGARGAFWGKPNDESWPPEIDVVEVYGDERERADLTVHWMERGRRKRDKERFIGPDFSDDFHVFGAHWSEDEIVWYVDGVERMRTRKGTRFMNDGGPFYAMLEGQVVRSDSTCGIWPYYSIQYVDYVRVWSQSPCSPSVAARR